ncbi:TPA: DUF2345 domain-containing protein, partial [Proteus mirabilis]
ITSAKDNDIYAHQNEDGFYWVKFDADRDEKPMGYESMPVRLAKPYAGDTYGMHFPLIQGTEVAIAFHEGDPDRPYIAHALHDSRHPDHITDKNNTRNVIRTPANNKLRMEDKRGEEHIKLSSEYGGKSQLNLGHIVDANRDKRGEGFELRTDSWGAIRAGKGLFISADNQAKAGGEVLAMDEAIEQLSQALEFAQSMMQLATNSDVKISDHEQHTNEIDNNFNQLSQASLVASSPTGIALSTTGYMQQSSGDDLVITSSENASMTAFRRLTLAAKKGISVFAHELGAKIVAAFGKVEIEAQDDEMALTAQKAINITSNEDEIKITANKKITLQCNGASVTLENGKITLMTSGDIDIKASNVNILSPENNSVPLKGFTLCEAKSLSSTYDNEALVKMD